MTAEELLSACRRMETILKLKMESLKSIQDIAPSEPAMAAEKKLVEASKKYFELRQFAESLLDRLPENDARVLYGMFFLGQNAAQVGKEMFYSRSGVWVIRDRALKKVDEMLKNEHFLTDLDLQ